MKTVGVWLSTEQLHYPNERDAYIAHSSLITHAHPVNGGTFDGAGNVSMHDYRLNWSFPLELRSLATSFQHVYAPILGCSDPLTLLDAGADVWQDAIDNLLAYATARFDWPWDGVMFDIEGVALARRDKLNDFYEMVCGQLRDLGLLVCGWFHINIDGLLATDWSVYGDFFDQVHVSTAHFSNIAPYTEMSIYPIWWVEAGLRDMLDAGMPPSKIVLSIRFLAQHCFGPARTDTKWTPYYEVQGMLDDAGNPPLEWVDHFPAGAAHPESTLPGSVQEWRADLGGGEYLWVEDELTTRLRLALATKYGVSGTSLFRPSLGNPDSWITIAGWEDSPPEWRICTQPAAARTYTPRGGD